MPGWALSPKGTPIRLPDERWAHVLQQHGELAEMRLDVLEAVANPERVVAGGAGELLAIREHQRGKWLVVAYRELGSDDGFVITAFLTSKTASLERRRQLWP